MGLKQTGDISTLNGSSPKLVDKSTYPESSVSSTETVIDTPNNNQHTKKRTCKNVDFAVPTNHRIKLKEFEKKDMYHDIARELKKNKLWNMQVTIIPNVIGAFGSVTKGLLKGLEDLEVGGRVERSKLLHYWIRPEYWEESGRLEETCCHSNSSRRPSANTDVKKYKGVNNNNNINFFQFYYRFHTKIYLFIIFILSMYFAEFFEWYFSITLIELC